MENFDSKLTEHFEVKIIKSYPDESLEQSISDTVLFNCFNVSYKDRVLTPKIDNTFIDYEYIYILDNDFNVSQYYTPDNENKSTNVIALLFSNDSFDTDIKNIVAYTRKYDHPSGYSLIPTKDSWLIVNTKKSIYNSFESWLDKKDPEAIDLFPKFINAVLKSYYWTNSEIIDFFNNTIIFFRQLDNIEFIRYSKKQVYKKIEKLVNYNYNISVKLLLDSYIIYLRRKL